jgi:hypothetical protein
MPPAQGQPTLANYDAALRLLVTQEEGRGRDEHQLAIGSRTQDTAPSTDALRPCCLPGALWLRVTGE